MRVSALFNFFVLTKFFLSTVVTGFLLMAGTPSYSFAAFANEPDSAYIGSVDSVCTEDDNLKDYRYRSYDYEEFNSIYSFVPSTMNLWRGGSWSSINARYEFNERNFKSTQMFSREYLYGFDSESIQKIDSLDVTFYGKFLYNTTRAFDASYNLFYKHKNNGSPFYLFTPAKGNWQTQTYLVKGGASKSFFNRKLHVGVMLSYTGDMFNRVLDTRNSNIDLNTEVHPSLTYMFTPDHAFSFGVNYRRNKMEPRLSNYFPRPGDEENYWIYINKGMGTFEHVNTGYSVFSITHSLDYTANWHLKIDGLTLSADASYLDGGEEWQTKFSRPNTADLFEIAKYDWNRIIGRISLSSPASRWNAGSVSSLEYEMLDGLGYTFNESAQLYQKAYSYNKIQIKFNSDLLFDRNMVNKLGVNFVFEVNDALDLNYGHKSSFTNLNSVLKIGAMKMPVLKGSLYVDLDFMHNLNLVNSHNPLSADSNIFTVNIHKPYLRYRTTDYIAISPVIVWEKRVSKNIAFGVELSGILLNPYNENYVLNASFGGSDVVEYGSNKGADLTIRVIF